MNYDILSSVIIFLVRPPCLITPSARLQEEDSDDILEHKPELHLLIAIFPIHNE